jgi:hypothetical protein
MQFSEWAALIVAVSNGDGSIRICGDYKVTANKAMIVDTHPMHKIEELFTALIRGLSFMKLDLSHVYLHWLLDESAQEYLVITQAL